MATYHCRRYHSVRGAGRLIEDLNDIGEVVSKHRARLLRFVMFSLGDADAAASIVQDTFLKAYNNRETFRNDCSISTWLTGIALNLVRDYHRNRRFRFWHKVGKTSIDVIESANFLPGSERPVEVQVLARERARCVAVAVESLSVRQRTVFIMRFVDDMDLSEIAQVSGMPVNTVKTHLRRALKSVKEHVRDSGL